jgi:neutral ceramidase
MCVQGELGKMKSLFAGALTIFIVGTPHESSAQNLTLTAGAAKVDVTPAETELPRNYEGILDRLYARAIVIENGMASAALISLDAGGVSEQIWQNVTKQVESELGIPAKNILMTATHTHSAPGQQAARYVPRIVEAVRLAKQRLAPARVGYGNGVSYINVNRNIIDPQTKRWWEGPILDLMAETP